MYNKISVTPGEYVSFIELCDKGHRANKHGWKMVVPVVVVGLKPGSITQQMPPPRHKNKAIIRPGFHYTTNATTTTQKQSDYKVEQSSFTLIALFLLEIGRCRGRNWLNGNQA